MQAPSAKHTVQEVTGIFHSALRVLSHEVALAKVEMSENLGRAGTALIVLLIGAAFAFFAIAALLWAAVSGLVAAGWPVWGAALLVAGLLGILALACIGWALRNLQAKRLAPTRSLHNVQRDLTVLKEAFDG